MAQEIVVNYDEAQREKSTPDYSVHGAKRETENKRGRLDRAVEMMIKYSSFLSDHMPQFT